ncbi:MAG: TolC family protein [Sideroxyarcus sp.]|nr:TolC family protein [Sideroxyarcus sp.]
MNSGSIIFGRLNAFWLAAVLAGAGMPCAGYADAVLDQDLAVTAQPGMLWQSSETLKPPVAPAMPGLTSPVTLAELTDYALRNNPSTREAWEAARAQAAALGIAGAAYYPTLDGLVSLTRGKTSINSSSGVVSGSTQTRLSPSISLGYVLFDFGARSSAKQAAGYNLLAANLAQNRALQAVVLRVEQTYYQLLAARQTIVAGEETLKNVQTSLDAANARRQAGLATIGDVYQAETLLAQSRLQLRRAQGEAGKLKGALCNAVGLPVNAKLELAPPEARPPSGTVRAAVEDYLDAARTNRPDLGAAEAQARAAQADADAASAQGYPSLDLSIAAGKTYNDYRSGSYSSSSSNGSIGINLRIPLFDGFKTTYSVRQAQARAGQMEAARDRVALQVELDVWQAYFDLDTAEAAIDSAQALLRSAGQAREVAQARYRAGVGNLPDLLLAQANEANARMEVIQAEMGWYASLSQLNNSIGTLETK